MADVERNEPAWLNAADALAIHDRQLSEHGGGSGVCDMGMLESALGRPVDQWHYGEDDPAALAAAYAFGIARNHPFVDGNKRTAWVVARLFLVMNGQSLSFYAADAIKTVLALAAGELAEDELANWFRTSLAI